MRRVIGLALLLGAAPVAAADLVAPEFAARVSGRTIAWSTADGRLHGMEQYLPGGAVIWRFPGETCMQGRWQGVGTRICFTYDGLPGTQCWHFAESADALTALAEGAPEEERLVATGESRVPLACPGPWLGS
ncbi:MAG: hypothetical protein CVT80_07375 [Alphaproteobacteria bacterium HGW-Alphaproteobacteria-2]|nr:MAG: hypothetical protein CVT80_07375 [Alphaproteobacteria bacterium HGW-Alphaproteobacteria-2]